MSTREALVQSMMMGAVRAAQEARLIYGVEFYRASSELILELLAVTDDLKRRLGLAERELELVSHGVATGSRIRRS